jgi:putative hydrolase of the HAD superfamily
MLKAIVFDWDNTLLDWSGFSGDWQSMARERLGPVYTYLNSNGHTLPEFEPFVVDINERSGQAWQSVQSGTLDAPRLVNIVRESLASYGLDMTTVNVEDLLQRYRWGQILGTRLYPEVKSVLDALREAGLRLGLLTNAFQPMWMRDKELRELGIIASFDCRLSAADVGKLKPHPLPFEQTLRCLETPVENAVFVGDSLEHDIVGAKGVGMRTVWRHNAGDEFDENDLPAADATIGALDELLPLLDQWFPGWRNGRG